MKDYEKRQKDKKGQYKGSIHTNKKKWSFWNFIADVALVILFIYFLAMFFANRGQ